MNRSRQQFQRGFSLIEVFVALLVLSVGLIALAKLQVDLVRGGGDARTRTMALSLAEGKIEDLRTFTVSSDTTACSGWSPAASPMCWSYIANNAGGRIASGAITVAGVQYTLGWTASERDFTGTGPMTSRTMDVVATVTWVNEQGATQTVTSNANIVDIPPGAVTLASQPVSGRPSGPLADYTPGGVPEVVAVPINNGSGGKRETTKPLPDVMAQGGYTHMVTFNEVNYHKIADNASVIDRQEQFRTVNCRCALAGAGRARTPARISYVNGMVRDRPGAVIVSKAETGVALTTGNTGVSSQPPACDICCRDHHDGPTQTVNGTTDYNRYNPTATSDHLHYLVNTDKDGNVTGYTQAKSAGDAYDEACRMKIVNGVLQVFQDWQLQTVTVMPKSDLANANGTAGPNLANYTTAVQNFVMGVASAQAGVGTAPTNLSAWFTPSAVSINPATSQLLARAIYIDYMPPNLLTAINGILTDVDPTNDSSIMALVPFYEVHMTKLADWSTTNIKQALVSSDTIKTDTSGSVTVSPVYSRGFVQPASSPTAGSPLMVASLKSHNTGITDTPAVTPALDAFSEAPHPVTLNVLGQGNSAVTYYSTATNPSSETSPATSQHKDGFMSVSVAANTATISITGTMKTAKGSDTVYSACIGTPIVSGGACKPSGAGNGLESFTCTVTSGWTGTIQFSTIFYNASDSNTKKCPTSSSAAYVFCGADDGADATKGNNATPAKQCTPLPSNTWTQSTPLTDGITALPIFVSTPVP